jgi:hypothetical protein
MEPTIAEVFGSLATQTEDDLIIKKSDLAAYGLTPSSSNTAESLLVAIFLQARGTLTQENFQIKPEQNIYYSEGFPSFTTKGENAEGWRVEQLQWNISQPNSGVTLNPNDY